MCSSPERILILEPEGYSPAALARYAELGPVFRHGHAPGVLPEEVTVLVVRLAHHLNAERLARYPRLRAVVSPTTGLNHIDLKTCESRGIEVVSLRGETAFLESVTATAEHALALMLALVRRIPAAHAAVVDEDRWARDDFCARDLSCLTLGIIGFGRLGRRVAGYGHALGMTVLACDPHATISGAGVESVPLDDLLARSDVVTLHADCRSENRHLLGVEAFGRMRGGAWFVNTARGELVDESALVAALERGQLAGAAVDVLDGEAALSAPSESPLVRYARGRDNVIITPHVGGCTSDSMRKTEVFCAEKLARVLGRTEES